MLRFSGIDLRNYRIRIDFEYGRRRFNSNSKLPTIWRVEKQLTKQRDEVKSEERRCNSAKSQKKADSPASNVREVAK